jgi:hypothetical protein
MPPTVEVVTVGLLTFTGTFTGHDSHVDVKVRGKGVAGQRPLCGTLRLSHDEWDSLFLCAPSGGWRRPPKTTTEEP